MTTDRQRIVEILAYCGVLAALLPLFAMRDFSPDNELRYLGIADEALRNHTFFSFTSHGVPYADKPPLYLWIVMLLRSLTGLNSGLILSLFSLIPAFGVIRVMDQWVKNEMSPVGRLAAGLMLMTSVYFLGPAVIMRMDMLMTLFIILAFRSFWRIIHDCNVKREQWLFPVWIFLAVFTKGPLGFGFPLVGTLAYLVSVGRWREAGKMWGWRTWLVLLGGCSAWFGAVFAEGGPDYLNNLLFHQTVGRAVNAFYHSHPFYYYCIAIWYIIAPWSLLLLGSLGSSVLFGRKEMGETQKFFGVAALASFILVSCVDSKLQVYTLPLLPLLVYACALSLPKFNLWAKRVCLGLPLVVLTAALPAFVFLVHNGLDYLDRAPFYVAAALLSAGALSSVVILFRAKENVIEKSAVCAAATLIVTIFAGSWGVPSINQYIGYNALSQKIKEVSELNGCTGVTSWHLSSAECLDVLLGYDVNELTLDEFPDPPSVSELEERLDNTLFVTSGKYAEAVYSELEPIFVGNSAIIYFPAKAGLSSEPEETGEDKITVDE